MSSTLHNEKIPAKHIFYFRQRLKNKIFQSTLAYFSTAAKERNMTKKDLANLLNKDPAQITRWFHGPNNWTLDTLSDLLLAMDAELKHEIVPLPEIAQHHRNRNEQDNVKSQSQGVAFREGETNHQKSASEHFFGTTFLQDHACGRDRSAMKKSGACIVGGKQNGTGAHDMSASRNHSPEAQKLAA